MVANTKRHPRENAALDGARARAARMGQEVTAEAKALKEQAVHKAEDVTRQVKRESERFLNDQKRLAAGRVERIGSVMHQAARVLERGDVGTVAQYVDMAAAGATAASKYLEQREVGELVEDVADVVRRHPMATFGAMMIAGLAVARFVKAGQAAPDSAGAHGRQRTAARRRRR